MSPIFVSQETIDRWLTEDRIDVEGERITLKPYGLAVELVPRCTSSKRWPVAAMKKLGLEK